MAAGTAKRSTEVTVILEYAYSSRTEFQKLNFDRIFTELEKRNILHKGIADVVKLKPSVNKCMMLKSFLQSREVSDFEVFLRIVITEDDLTYKAPSKEFISLVSKYPGWEDYEVWLDYMETSALGTVTTVESEITHKFIQIGSDSVFTVGREGTDRYDPVHGITLYIPSNSLPHDTKEVEVTIKVGFASHNFSPDMVACSATIVIQCVPQVLFTKHVFLEVPHSVSSADTSDLCFVRFKDDAYQSDDGEVHKGIFPPDHPYGVIMTNSFSSHVVVKGKRYFNHQSLLRKSSLKYTHKEKFSRLVKRRADHRQLHCDGHDCTRSFWFCVSRSRVGAGSNKNRADCTFSFSVAQYTPTGFQAVKQYIKGQVWDCYLAIKFRSDSLVFHPQSAEDCGWIASIDGYFKISKREAEKLCNENGQLMISTVRYNLAPKQQDLHMPRITVNVTGANKDISYNLTLRLPHSQDANRCEILYNLSMHPVEEDRFLQQLAYQLPVWQPVAQMLGLTASDIEHIEYDVPPSQGERAYKAFLQWMQKEGRYGATYDVLLQALCQATDVSDCKSITNAWWYAHQYLSNLAEQPVTSYDDL